MFVEVHVYLVSQEEVLGRETDELWGSLVPYMESHCRVKICVYFYSYGYPEAVPQKLLLSLCLPLPNLCLLLLFLLETIYYFLLSFLWKCWAFSV